MAHEVADVIVIGGGPAGSTAAALLAEMGRRTLLLERERFPRFHVGESLMPQTYWTFKRLGVLDKLKTSAFPKKFSVQFVSENGKASQPFYFFETNPHESSQTWQVQRSDFDRMLLENAAEKGADVRTGVRVTDLLWDGERCTGVRAQHDGGDSIELPARVVVDATGQSSLIANRLELRRSDPYLRKASVWTYYRGARRDAGVDEGATLILNSQDKQGWFWYIPLPEDTVSVGVVSSKANLLRPGMTPEQIFDEQLARCPAVAERLEPGRRMSRFYATKDFSYTTTRWSGQGWVLVGDAFGFLDPIYSSGVFLALISGEWAADAIDEGFRKNDFSAEQLGKWGHRFSEGMGLLKKLVYAFYTRDFRFGDFIRRYPQYRKNLVDLLVGDVFKPGVGEIFEAMGEVLPVSDDPGNTAVASGTGAAS
jgi:geranylgeranyl reductase family protein